jgi:hypothetical protein
MIHFPKVGSCGHVGSAATCRVRGLRFESPLPFLKKLARTDIDLRFNDEATL